MSNLRDRLHLPNVNNLSNKFQLDGNISQINKHSILTSRSSHSLHGFNNTSSLYTSEAQTERTRTLRSKSPSCKQFIAQTLTKKKMPISKLSVVQYKDLLSYPDNDPSFPDMSIHIPIDNDETKFFLQNTAISFNNQFKKSASVFSKSNKSFQTEENSSPLNAITYSNLFAGFIPFKNSKEINKHAFGKQLTENPSLTSLDSKQIFPITNATKLPLVNDEKSSKIENKQNDSNNSKVNDNTKSNTLPTQPVEQTQMNNDLPSNKSSNQSRNNSPKGFHTENSKTQRDRSRIELSLMHNKDILEQINSNLMWESRESYDFLSNQLQAQQQIMKSMPKVRQYPIFKKKQIPPPMNNNNNSPKRRDTNFKTSQKSIIFQGSEQLKKEQGEEDKKVRFTQNPSNGKYQVYWYSLEQNNWKPDIRELSSIVIDYKKAYVFGGVGKELYNQLFELDLETVQWKQMSDDQQSGASPCPRFGHSCNILKRSLVFFGGEYRPGFGLEKFKDCLCDIFTYNLDSKQWKQLVCQGSTPQSRKSHASAIVGRNLIIQGGFNGKNQALKDMWILDLGSLIWNEAEVNGEFEAGFHQCEPVYHSQRCGKINLYKFSDIKITKWGASIEEEGIYFFGGKNTKGEIMGDLKILKTDCKPMQWIKPETKGKAPRPRYGHSMNFAIELNFLAIYGGKNDFELDVYFGDLNMLNLSDFTWISVIVNGKISPPRANHSACIYDSKLVIFGGINLDGFLPPFVNILDLDNVTSSKMSLRDENSSYVGRFSLQHQSSLRQSASFTSPKKIIKNSQTDLKLDSFQVKEQPVDTNYINENVINSLSFNNFKSFLPSQKQGKQPIKKSIILNQPPQLQQDTQPKE